MCDCFLQIVFLCIFHNSTLLFSCLLIKSEKYCCLHFFILMLTYSYTFCTFIHVGGFKWNNMGHNFGAFCLLARCQFCLQNDVTRLMMTLMLCGYGVNLN